MVPMVHLKQNPNGSISFPMARRTKRSSSGHTHES